MQLDPEFLRRPLAHRGLHDGTKSAPENSLAAFRCAIAGGYGIELDLQLSKDGQAIVFHDYELDRLTDKKGAVALKTAAQLAETHLLAGDETIPTLVQVLELTEGRVPVLIEIKDQDGQCGPNTGALEAETARVLKTYDGPVAVMSFNPHAIFALKSVAPGIARGLATSSFVKEDWPMVPESRLKELAEIPDFDALDAAFVSHDKNNLASAPIDRLKRRGVPVLCWTIRSEAEEKQARKFADNITFENYRPMCASA